LLPALARAKEASKRSSCSGNLRQIALAIRMYADDWRDSLPVLPDPNPYPNGVGAFYKQLVKSYLGLTGPASPAEKIFACPSDPTIRTQATHAFTSYTFNGYETGPESLPRITGQRLAAVQNPSRGVLVGEYPAYFGGSWHPTVMNDAYPDAKNTLGFVDGHSAFTRIYWNGVADSDPCNYEPPAGYDYSWDGK
jgi:hypothetical protein